MENDKSMINLRKFYRGKKILITGASGFKGAWLTSWLLQLGSNIVGTGFNPNENKNLFYKLNLHKKIKYKTFDLRNLNKLNNIVLKNKPSIIFHLAPQPLIHVSYKKPYDTFDINIKGSLNILEIAKRYKFIKSVVIVTSDKCYESNNSTVGFRETDKLGGIDPYSASKASIELIAKAYIESFFLKRNNIGVSTARAGNVIGGGDWSSKRLIPDVVKSLLNNKKILIRNPNFNRPWQLVLEPLKGYLILAKKQFEKPKTYSGAWNFGTNPRNVTNVKKIVKYMVDYWGSGKIQIRKNNFYEQVNLQLNSEKSKKLLKWKPTYSIKNGTVMTTDWYKRVYLYKQNPSKVTVEQLTKYMDDSKIN